MTEGLRNALARLDGALQRAAAIAGEARPLSAADRFRGLYIDGADVPELFSRAPGEPWFVAGEPLATEDSPFLALAAEYGLSSFDLDVLLIALAPELDLRYERLYGYLQDDITRRRATVDLTLNLLCASAAEKLERRTHFASTGPLLANGLIRLIADPAHTEPPLLSHYVRLDEQVVNMLLSQRTLDARLAGFCRYEETIEPTTLSPLAAIARNAVHTGLPLRLYFDGPDAARKVQAARVVAGASGRPLLVADLSEAPAGAAKLALAEARARGAVLYAEGAKGLGEGTQGIVILAGVQPSSWPGAIVLRFDAPDCEERTIQWTLRLAECGNPIAEEDAAMLASRFTLTTEQIREAARCASHLASARDGEDAEPDLDDLAAAARLQTGHQLATLARRIEPRHSWDDIVLQPDVHDQLRELCARAGLGRRVLEDWGFERTLSLGKGVTALFSGQSGTGKTLAAEIIARELQYDLYRIDLSGIVSKYIGETEKNLDRIFAAAENANAILFFDEAEALFGKRSEVHDSHDRYANIEVAYLLQKMEEYRGVAILATNLRQNLDDAFTRRLTFCVQFPFPDEASRRRIWENIWPAETPVEPGLDFSLLARSLKLSGGSIKNIALAAAFLAAAAESPVCMEHLLQAARREFQKLGKQLTTADLLEQATP